MKLKIFFLLVIFNFVGGCSCDCKAPRYLDVTGLTVNVRHLTKLYPTLPPVFDDLDSTQKVDFDSLGIGVSATGNYYGLVQPSSFSFISSAYACKCPMGGSGGSLERIQEIKIVSAYPFTASGSANDLLNQYFDVVDFTHRELPQPLVNLDALIPTHPKLTQSGFFLRLKTKPTGSKKHKFTIKYTQTNGEIYSVTTQEILFN